MRAADRDRTGVPRKRLHLDEHPGTTLVLEPFSGGKLALARQLEHGAGTGSVVELDEPRTGCHHDQANLRHQAAA